MKTATKIKIIMGIITPIAAIISGTSNAEARSWTCNATIQLTGSSYSYTVPNWNMSGTLLTDREKACKTHIQGTWLNNGSIWQILKPQISPVEQNKICLNGGGTFRIDYGFDKRQKEWQFSQYVPIKCYCPVNMSFP